MAHDTPKLDFLETLDFRTVWCILWCMEITANLNIDSYKQGHLDTTFERICEVLGKPNRDDDWGKVEYSWAYNVDGEPVAIWDYKGVRWSYYGKRETLVKLFGEAAVQHYDN